MYNMSHKSRVAGVYGEMKTYQFTVVIEPDDGAFHAFVPALPGCHTFGATIDEARANITEAMELHIESMLDDGEAVPVEGEPLFVTRITVPVPA
jgi:predicted RNase H-like HicB family nuclease